VWGHLGGIEGERDVQCSLGDLSERIHLEEIDIDEMKLIKLNFKK